MDLLTTTPFSTLLELLQYRASTLSGSADNTAFTFLEDGEVVSGSLTYAALAHEAQRIAAHLQAVTQPGDRVLLVFPPGLAYITAFFACVYAGVIAVPALPPANARTLPRLRLIAQDAQPRVALTLRNIAVRIEEFQSKITDDGSNVFGQLPWLSSDDLPAVSPVWAAPASQPDDVVFLQYTSGSTGAPKGVMVSHGNILANVQLIHLAFGIQPSEVVVSWLPPHHDMGLIGKILYPVYAGCHCVQFPPAAFLMRPYRWLKALSDYRARITGAPNFAFDLCVSKVTDAQKQTLDLSALEFALNGAEPIRLDTLQRFTQAFAVCGFRPEAMAPVYGLAESTLLVTANVHHRQAAVMPRTLAVSKAALARDTVLEVIPVADDVASGDAIEIVSVGPAESPRHHVIIVAPASLAIQPAGRVGEIWISGPSVAHGYWQREEESLHTFAGHVNGDTTGESNTAYLRTGDLGFIYQDHLYIAGRIKDMMIFNGRNLYPQDVEATVEALDPAFRVNGCAVFSIDGEAGPQLAIIQEIESRKEAQLDHLISHLHAELAEQHELIDIAAIVLVKAGHIPRTSSGKIQRLRCKQLFLSGEFAAIWSWRNQESNRASAATPAAYIAPETDTEIRLAAIWEALLDLKDISATADFFALGGHSLLATQVVSQMRTAFGIDLPLRTLFEASTLRALARRITLAQDGSGATAAPVPSLAPAITARDRSAVLPPALSFAQQRLWFLDQLEPGSALYNIPAALRLTGQLDVVAFRKTLNEIVRRHEALRTTFSSDDGAARQVIAAALELGMPLTDLSTLPAAEAETEAQRLIQVEATTPFDLTAEPLIRANLLRLGETEHLILITIHHIVSDGWSMGVLVREVAALYAAYVHNVPSPLPELAVQYADFAQWQRQWLASGVLAQQIPYWTGQLADAPGLLTLPTDRPRPAVQSYRGASLPFTLSTDATASLHALGQRHQATLFMTLSAAFNVLLARYSGQTDICIGTPIANRNRVETEDLIGFFVNTLVLRAQVNPGDAFTTLLQQVRGTALSAYAHQDVPFEQLVDALKLERHLGHAPLFQVMLVLQNAPMDHLTLPGLALQLASAGSSNAKFDLTLSLRETAGQLRGELEYSTDLFDATTMTRMLGHFSHLLDAIIANPTCRIGDLPLMGAAEQQQLLLEWNNTATVYPAAASLQQLFEAQVASTPEAVALVFDDVQFKSVQLSYAELNARANRLAHHLRSLGVGPDVLVGVCAERSLEMVISLYAILKAGGAYVPLDPAYPSDRLAFMLDDANPAVLLTQSTLLASLPPQAQNHRALFCLDTQWGQLAGYPTDNPTGATGPAHSANLAYVIYTSGSTGRPKGVGIDHAGIINRLQWMQTAYQLTADDRVLQKTPFSFDVSVWEFFWPLITGATLVVAKPGGHQDADYLADLIRQHAITTLHFVPPMLDVFLNAAGAAQCASLRQVMCSGQALPGELQQRFLRQLPNAALHNLYGPTEASVDVTFWQCRADAKAVPIGRPIANIQIHILDAQLNPVPQGVAGELHIAGIGLARGYINRPDLSADKFIPNPFASAFGAAGTRMYKSGDLARYLADGVIEYLGRIDDQVKIRGFRIELGEIEAALAALPAVRECIVLAREDAPGVATSGDKRLVAYVVRQQDASASADATETDTDTDADTSALTAQLRAALAQTLPDYMVPAHFIVLDQLPLTTNGKVDRKALPAPDMVRSERGYVAPRDATEKTLAAIWADILGLDKVGIHDNFFTLGGHSLLATQVISKVRTAFGIDLPLRALFEAPDLATLSARITQASLTPDATLAPAITPIERTGPLALSFAQQRLWFLDQLEPGSALYNVPGAIRLTGNLDVAAFGRTLNEVVRRHEALRTTFASVDGAPVQIIAPALELTLSLTDLSALSHFAHAERAAHAQQLMREEAQKPFDLSSGPLLRASLLRLDAGEHIVLLTMHHIVSDGWSLGVLVREIASLYDAYVQGLPSPLPELTVQYADFAAWQRQWLRGDVLARQRNYWTGQLADAPNLLALPTDRPRPAVQSHRGASLPFSVAASTTASLHALSQRQQATMFMTVTAAFNVLLARYSGQSDICIGTPIANRNRTEIESLIGFFVNTLVLRAQVNAADTFNTLLQQVRATALSAYAHQDVPFEQLVEALKPERHLGHAPLFQVMLVLQNTPLDGLALPGLHLQNIDYDSVSAKFDLTLNLAEADGQLRGAVEYNTDLFDAATITRMMGHFSHLLDAIVANPASRIGDLPLMDAAEQRDLLHQWNDTATAYPATQTIHQLFEAQAAHTPDALAVAFGDGHAKTELTYAQLNARANQLAHHLRSLGVGPDVLVGICAERSLALIVGLLAILKAGGAYAPLDPGYPKDRLALMLTDAQPVVLLTQSHLLDHLPAHQATLFCLDSGSEMLDVYPATNSATAPSTGPANLAYVMYTSGSTGTPKGIAITHQNVVRLVKNTNYVHLQAGNRVLQFAPVSFDASTFEIWGPLLNGASVIVLPPGPYAVEELGAAIIAQRIDTMWLTAALFNQMVEHQLPSLLSMRHILAGGEALSLQHVRQFLDAMPSTLLTNGYGPTESTTFACCFAIPQQARFTASVPIGHPIANTQVYILDHDLHPVPQGVAGELHIAGDGLARGYLHRPDLSAEKFIPNPFASVLGQPGARMYKSGDLARYLPDGAVEYLGRIDHQVKIRGFRIELGEIEAALAALPSVRDCLVVVRDDKTGEKAGDKRLVAYLVAQESTGQAHDGSDLTEHVRSALAQSLPGYMIPAHFVCLNQFPLTPNGKVDRNALPAPDLSRSESGYLAPATPTEVALAAIWSSILGLDQVSASDNFFALGGHSLLATQVVSHLRAARQIDLPLRSLFEAPTLAALAERIDLAQQQSTQAAPPPMHVADRSLPLALSFAQQRLWFLDQLEPGSTLYNVAGALRLTGHLDVVALRRTLNEVVRRHEALRTRFATVDGNAVQIIAPELVLALPVTSLLSLPAAQRAAHAAALVLAEAQTPFDLSTGPLLRASLLQLDDGEPADHIVLITMHHIVSDGWSLGILIREVAALYAAYVQDLPSPLPPLPLQYADFAQWQRQWLRGDVLAQQIDYWRTQLADAPALLTLPTDRPRPAVQSYRGKSLPLVLDTATTTALHALGQRTNSTLFMTLLALFNILMARYAGQTDICVGTPIANRNRADIEAMIGFFINTLVLRSQVNGDDSFEQLLYQVRATALAAYAHQDVPFEQLIDALKPERHLGHNPLFQVALVLQNMPTDTLNLPGLQLRPEPADNPTTKYDLTLTFTETSGQLQGSFEYNTDLFDQSTAARMIGHFQQLTAAVIANPAGRIASLAMLTATERAMLLTGFNQSQTSGPQDCLIHQLFERQAAAQPDAIALTLGEQRLSYDALNRRANQLAHYLIALGIRPDDRVAICVERGIDMIVGMLATLKAGGAYVPLDPTYPEARLAYMLADSAPIALLTVDALQDDLPASSLLRLIVTDSVEYGDAAQIAQQPDHNPDPAARGLTPHHLAYLMYTSGSTGQPKGVMVEHGNVVHLVMDSNYARISAADCIAHCANPAFDAATWEIWAALLHGASVLVIEPALLLTPEQFCQALQAGGVTAMWLTVALLNQYVEALAPVLPHLNYLLFGGDRADVSTVRHVFQHCRPRHLVNGYGPTETTTFAVTYTVSALDDIAYGVPIGRPLQYAKVYILDQDRQPVPIGVTGEIYIGGAGVARGYLNQPELSAASFVVDPFADPGAPSAPARMYKSGDLGRWLPDGNIDYLGRNDFQVKIRGFRIELGEIEARLCACENVRDAVVIAREDTPGDKRLAAYLLADDEEEAFDPAELRRQLGKSLADYMIPSAFVTLTTFPLTANGKVNRKALPAPERSAAAVLQYAAPEGPLETAIAALWQELLGLPQVGRHDNFFELGGHSLLAVQLLSALRRTLHIEVALRDLFNQPTLAAFAEAVAQARAATMSAITRADRNAPLALSFAQQRLWFLDQLAPGTAFYNVPAAMRFNGTLDIDAFVRTLNEVVRRHESLRTSFATIDGAAVQIIAPSLHIALPLTDLSALPPDEREARARALIIAEAQTPFDLATGPVLRAGLLRMADDDHILLFTLHHIVSDAWSLGILLRELSAMYAAFVRNLPSPLPPLALQYADFAQWQRQWLSGEVMAEQIDYWRAQLADAPLMLALPTDRPRPALQSYRGASLPFAISAELTTGLNALAQRNQATLFMTLLAAFNVLMARHAGQTDICVGTPIANRSRTEIEALIGFFVNTLVLRTQINLAASFETLLQQVRATALDAYAHQDAPFEQLVDALKPERHLGHTPLFQVVFILQTAAIGALDLDGMLLQPVASESATAKFDLTVSLSETGDQISGAFEYNTDLFDAATIARMMGHFTQLLRAIVAAPAARIGGLPLMEQAERHQLLVAWNNTDHSYPKTSTLHQLFELQAAKTPDALAVVFDETTTLSYAELNSRANQLARHLRSMGVGPDVLVAICTERNAQMVVSLLAIWKAGGAYVPLDPAYPPERLAYMLDDAKPAVLLRQSNLLANVTSGAIPSFYPDAESALLNGYASDNLENTTLPANLANVIYTSGSTGRPKGVSLTHQAVNRLVFDTQAVTLQEGDRITQAASSSFDAYTFEVWGALLHGCQLCIVAYETIISPPDFAAQIKRQNVNVVFITTALLNQFALQAPAAFSGIRDLLFGGEAADPRAVKTILQHSAPQRLVNAYGPTESATFTLSHQVHAVPDGATGLPIGRPIDNTQIYLLDAELNPTPLGVAGELCIGGDGLARDYLRRPDLTAERFVPNPFSAVAGARMYKSGDLARYLPNGDIEYLGRIDNQVKISGFRIELGEIEAALAALPAVRECVVLAREDVPGEKRLAAYVVTHAPYNPQNDTQNDAQSNADRDTDGDTDGDTAQILAAIRAALLQALPAYMVPTHFIRLAQLPITPNGKLDHKALPTPDLRRSSLAHVAPGTATEITLAAIWASILGLDNIGANDNFFALGGHSLLATQVISQVRAAFQIDLPLRALFEAPALAALAHQIDQTRQSATTLPPPAITAIDRSGALALSFAQQRLWFLGQLEPGSALYNIPAALRLVGQLDLAAFSHTLNEVVRRHEALRTSFASIDGNAVQVIAPQLTLALPVTDLSTLPATEREARTQYLMHEEAKTPFDLATGPLLRASLLHLDQAEHIVLLTMHHIVSDGWSMGVLVREVAALYGAYVQNLPSPLPPLPIQYADFAHWQRQWLRGDVLAQQIDYWTRQLAQSPPLLALPTDRPRLAMQSFRGTSLPFVLPAATTANLHALAQRMQATLFMTLMAGFNVLLARYTGQSDLCVGTPIANRNHADIEALIGFFVNTLVLRTQVKPEDSFETLLQQVRNTALGAYAHQDVPFEQLVDAIKPERHLDHAPLFQVMLALQNAPMTKLDLPGLRLLPLSSDSATAKFDLTVLLSEIDGQVTGVFEYNSDLFDAATITRMMGHFSHLLEAVTRNSACPVGDLPLMAAAEQTQLIQGQLLLEQAPLHGIPPTLLMRDGAIATTATAPAAVRGYVLDPRRGLCPVGVAGELYLGGITPDPAQDTGANANWLPDPFNPLPGTRMIGTGECAKVRPDGSFVLLGKLDAQIDLRGFRIEAGVVEAALLALPGVRQALVTMRDDAQDDAQDGKYLAAFLVLQADAAFDVAETHRLLMPNLPDYMAPTRFAILDQFPLTPDGDIDRSALPAPELRTVKPVYVAPGTPTEIILADLWAEALSVEQVGIHDSFFDLGGQSLLVVVAVNQIEQQFEVNIPIELFFQYKTIFLISRYIDDINAARQASRNTNALPEGFSRIRI